MKVDWRGVRGRMVIASESHLINWLRPDARDSAHIRHSVLSEESTISFFSGGVAFGFSLTRGFSLLNRAWRISSPTTRSPSSRRPSACSTRMEMVWLFSLLDFFIYLKLFGCWESLVLEKWWQFSLPPYKHSCFNLVSIWFLCRSFEVLSSSSSSSSSSYFLNF